MELAPICMFVYNRPYHTQQVINSLKKNHHADESELYIYSDHAKSREHESKVNEVRDFIKQISGFKMVYIIERQVNFGLRRNITDGVSAILAQKGKIIVLEDDLIVSPHFLSYMNSALQIYENENKVMHIAAHIPPLNMDKDFTSFFFNVTTCWGWATWERAWKHYNNDSKYLFQTLRKKGKSYYFDVDGSYPYMEHLEKNVHGMLNTWAVRWYASVTLSDGLCLHPASSLVSNIGLDGSGENCGIDDHFEQISNKILEIDQIELKESGYMRAVFKKFYQSKEKKSFLHLFIRYIKYKLRDFKFKYL